MNPDEICSNCSFAFQPHNRFMNYQCRFRAPVNIQTTCQHDHRERWPIVEHNEWCGEFKRKEGE